MRLFPIIISALGVIHSLSAWATSPIHVELLGGRRWATETGPQNAGVQINETILSALYDWHYGTLFSVGPTFSYGRFRSDDLNGFNATEKQISVAALIHGKPKVNARIIPYARLRHVLYSKGELEGGYDLNSSGRERAEMNVDFQTDGLFTTAGIKYLLNAQTSLVAEAGLGLQTIERTGGEFRIMRDGVALYESSDDNLFATGRRTFNSKNITVGINQHW